MPVLPLRRSVARLALAAALAVLAAGAASAQDTCPCPPPEPETPLWTTRLGLAYLATSGNTETQTLGFDARVTRDPRPWGFETFGRYDRTEDDGVETAERWLAGMRGKWAGSETWNAFLEARFEQDAYAGFDLRTVVAAGATWDVVDAERHTLALDAGLTWTDEDRVPPLADASYLGALLGASYEWKLSDRAAFTERLVLFPNFEASSDWRLESTTALTADLTERLALQVGYDVRYRHEPLPGREDTDTTTRVSLVVSL